LGAIGLKSDSLPPVRYLRSIPAPIRLLSIGVLINNSGAYVTVFLTLILAVRHDTAWRIGLALAFTACCSVLGSAGGGLAVSRYGSRPVITASMAGSALFTALLILPGPYPLTVGTLCCVAVCNRAYMPAATTLVGRMSGPRERVQRYAFFQLAYNAGAAVGPPVATFLLTRSLTALFLLDAGTSAGFALAASRIPREPLASTEHTNERAGKHGRAWARVDHRYLLFCLGVMCVAACYGQQSGALPLTIRNHHYNLELLGIFFSANAIAVIFFQLPLSHVTRRLPVRIPLTCGGFGICCGYALLLAGTALPLLIVSTAMWTLGEIIFNPVTSAVAMMMSAPRTHAIYQGALSTFRTIGQVTGPALGVFAYSLRPSLPWLCCAVLAIAAVMLFLTFSKDRL
jgi:MFS family permease